MLSAVNTVNTQQNKSFTYNLLNLPLVATVSNGTATYTYDATGNKLRKVDVISGITTATDYISGIQYGTTGGTTSLNFIQTEEGKAVALTSGAYDYTYYLGDHLGNTRITFDTQSGSAVIQQADDYYPFGLEINRSVTSPKNEYLYSKKELQEEFTEYDFGKRYYDPIIARFNTIDGLAEKFSYMTPYQFCSNNPVWLKELDGLEGVKYTDASGVIHVQKNVVVMTERTQQIQKGASKDEAAKVAKDNDEIKANNEARVTAVKNELNDFYNGAEGGAHNSEGTSVKFDFNVTGTPDIDKKGKNDDKKNSEYTKIAKENGLPGTQTAYGTTVDMNAPAALITTEYSNSDEGTASVGTGVINLGIRTSLGDGWASHEVLHTLGLDDNDYKSGGLRNSQPERISKEEVDEVLKKSYDKKPQ